MTDNNADQAVAAKELENLKARAATMGVKYHPNIKGPALREKIQEAQKEVLPTQSELLEAADQLTKVIGESPRQKVLRKRREASRLVRVRVTCRNPAKSEWEGEIFTASNSVVGSFKKFVPFNNEAGWHIPQIILNMMEERQCQIFVNKKGKGKGKEGKLIKEFAIEIMNPLNPEELKDLATQQAIAHSID